MKVVIEVIPHDEHRYETVGDWWWEDDDTLQIRVSQMNDWIREMAVAEHELTEALWCKAAGVNPNSVDWFDKQFEKNRKPGNVDEPGDDPKAPYYMGHQFATKVEKEIFSEWQWAAYGKQVESL